MSDVTHVLTSGTKYRDSTVYVHSYHLKHFVALLKAVELLVRWARAAWWDDETEEPEPVI